VTPHAGVTLTMPAYLRENAEEALTLKVVSVFPNNADLNLPTIHAAVLSLEPHTGRVLALLEGGALTAIRTGAASGAATDLLARPDSHVAAIFGAGVQGRTQLEAVCTVREIERAWIFDPDPQKVAAFITEMASRGAVPADLLHAADPHQALAEADVICTATNSNTPVFDDADLKAGAHINGVGSYTPEMQEIPSETVTRALVVVDARTAALAEAGDVLQPIRRGLITSEHIHAEIGEIVAGNKIGRTAREQITFFKSVGLAVQDAAAAALVLRNAKKLGLGTEVMF